jgi:hypothetical protein
MDELQVAIAVQAYDGFVLAKRDLEYQGAKSLQTILRSLQTHLCILQLPSIITFALHFSDINKDDSDNTRVIFN